jgi:hypothetical protein
MRALPALAFPRFSRVGDPRRLVPVCWETWCSCIRTCRARIRGDCRVGWTLVGQDGDWQSRGKLFFAFFHVRVIFFTEVVFAFRFVPSFPGRLRPFKDQKTCVCLSVVLGAPFLRPCWEFYFSVNGPNNGFGTQWRRSQVASYRSFACGSASSSCSFTKRYDSFSDEPVRRFVDSDVLWDRSFATSAVIHTLAKESRGASKQAYF